MVLCSINIYSPKFLIDFQSVISKNLPDLPFVCHFSSSVKMQKLGDIHEYTGSNLLSGINGMEKNIEKDTAGIDTGCGYLNLRERK